MVGYCAARLGQRDQKDVEACEKEKNRRAAQGAGGYRYRLAAESGYITKRGLGLLWKSTAAG